MPSVDLRLCICGRKAALRSTFFLWRSLKQRLYKEKKNNRNTNDSSTSQHPLCCCLRAVLWAVETQQDQIWPTAPHSSRSEHRGAVLGYCIISPHLQVLKPLSSSDPKQFTPSQDSSIQEHLTPSHLAVLLTEEPTAGSKARSRQFSKFSSGVE